MLVVHRRDNGKPSKLIDAHGEWRLDYVFQQTAIVALTVEVFNANFAEKVAECTVHHSYRTVLAAKKETNTILGG